MIKQALFGLSLLTLGAASANAAVVTFNSSGAFSNITNCGAGGCSISGGGTVLGWGGINQSTLTAVAGGASFNVPPSVSSVNIGSIVWENNTAFLADNIFNATYTFTLNMTSPFAASDSQAFSLTLNQTPNPAGDIVIGLSNMTLSGINLGNPNVTVANLHFTEVGAGTYNAMTGTWTLPEGSLHDGTTSTLYIVADFLDATTTAAVPEASTWAMMLLGFLGVGTVAIRRQRRDRGLLRVA